MLNPEIGFRFAAQRKAGEHVDWVDAEALRVLRGGQRLSGFDPSLGLVVVAVSVVRILQFVVGQNEHEVVVDLCVPVRLTGQRFAGLLHGQCDAIGAVVRDGNGVATRGDAGVFLDRLGGAAR